MSNELNCTCERTIESIEMETMKASMERILSVNESMIIQISYICDRLNTADSKILELNRKISDYLYAGKDVVVDSDEDDAEDEEDIG